MLNISKHSLHTKLCREECLQRIRALIYENAWDGVRELSKVEGLPFTGHIEANEFKISMIQRGRIMPMPKITGKVVELESGCQIELHSRASINAAANIVLFSAAAIAMMVLMIRNQQSSLLAFAIFPLLIVGVSIFLLRRESAQAVAVLRQGLEKDL